MRISKKTQYGLRAMVYLAKSFKKDKAFPLREIAKKEGIPFDYLEKIMSKLEKAGLIKSKRGVQGGYFLARSPTKIRVGEIIRILEGILALVRCVAREKKEKYNCPRKRICKSFFVWEKIQDVLNSTLDSITLAYLLKSRK